MAKIQIVLEMVETEEVGTARFTHPQNNWPYGHSIILRIPLEMWKDLESPEQLTVSFETGDLLEDATDTGTSPTPVNEIDNG